MTTITLALTQEQQKWCDDWATLSGYQSSSDGIIEVLKVVGAIPKGSSYWNEKFSFAED